MLRAADAKAIHAALLRKNLHEVRDELNALASSERSLSITPVASNSMQHRAAFSSLYNRFVTLTRQYAIHIADMNDEAHQQDLRGFLNDSREFKTKLQEPYHSIRQGRFPRPSRLTGEMITSTLVDSWLGSKVPKKFELSSTPNTMLGRLAHETTFPYDLLDEILCFSCEGSLQRAAALSCVCRFWYDRFEANEFLWVLLATKGTDSASWENVPPFCRDDPWATQRAMRQAHKIRLIPPAALHPIEECTMLYSCPMFAENLQTKSGKELFCTVCDKSVFEVSTLAELRGIQRTKRTEDEPPCVRFTSSTLQPSRNVNIYVAVVGETLEDAECAMQLLAACSRPSPLIGAAAELADIFRDDRDCRSAGIFPTLVLQPSSVRTFVFHGMSLKQFEEEEEDEKAKVEIRHVGTEFGDVRYSLIWSPDILWAGADPDDLTTPEIPGPCHPFNSLSGEPFTAGPRGGNPLSRAFGKLISFGRKHFGTDGSTRDLHRHQPTRTVKRLMATCQMDVYLVKSLPLTLHSAVYVLKAINFAHRSAKFMGLVRINSTSTENVK